MKFVLLQRAPFASPARLQNYGVKSGQLSSDVLTEATSGCDTQTTPTRVKAPGLAGGHPSPELGPSTSRCVTRAALCLSSLTSPCAWYTVNTRPPV